MVVRGTPMVVVVLHQLVLVPLAVVVVVAVIAVLVVLVVVVEEAVVVVEAAVVEAAVVEVLLSWPAARASCMVVAVVVVEKGFLQLKGSWLNTHIQALGSYICEVHTWLVAIVFVVSVCKEYDYKRNDTFLAIVNSAQLQLTVWHAESGEDLACCTDQMLALKEIHVFPGGQSILNTGKVQ